MTIRSDVLRIVKTKGQTDIDYLLTITGKTRKQIQTATKSLIGMGMLQLDGQGLYRLGHNSVHIL